MWQARVCLPWELINTAIPFDSEEKWPGINFNKTFTSVAIVFRLQNNGYTCKLHLKLTPALCQRGVVGLTILFSEFRQGTGAEMRPVVLGSSLGRCRSAIRESSVKQQRRRRLRKRHLEVNLRFFKLYRAYSILSNIGNFCLELSSRALYQSSGKEKESCCLVFLSSTNREIRHFHVVIVQKRQRNIQKSVMHVQSCCLLIFAVLVDVAVVVA